MYNEYNIRNTLARDIHSWLICASSETRIHRSLTTFMYAKATMQQSLPYILRLKKKVYRMQSTNM